MKNNAMMNDAEFDRAFREFSEKMTGGPNKTFGFYIHMALMSGAAIVIVWNRAWNILCAVPLLAVMVAVALTKSFVWNWTEGMLRKDAEDGRTERAEYWDVLALVIDWLLAFAVFSMMSFAVFALADGYGMPHALVWLCVGGMHTIPLSYPRGSPGYDWGNFAAWEQWTLLAIVAISAFFPVEPAWGVAAQAAVAFVSLPLNWRRKRPDTLRAIEGYRRNYKIAMERHAVPLPTPRQYPAIDFFLSVYSKLRIHWFPFVLSLVAFFSGIVWTLCLRRPIAILLAILAAVLGYLSQMMVECPADHMPEDIKARNVDIELTRDFFVFRGAIVFLSMGVAAVVVLWLGGHDATLLAAFSLLAVGSCHLFSYVDAADDNFKVDPLSIVVHALALASVCRLRVSMPGFFWWECLLPLPVFAYVIPIFRWFFPRSGLHGRERKAAIADMPRRLKADIRTNAEKNRDEKIEKRRLRDERRLARFRKSRGGQ